MNTTTTTDPACGTTGCEAHDGECRNNWGDFNGPAVTTLSPARVSTRQFSYRPADRTFIGEISATNGFGRVYPDACDEGLTMVSHRTGTEKVFVVVNEERDREGDLTKWTLRSRDGFTLVLFND